MKIEKIILLTIILLGILSTVSLAASFVDTFKANNGSEITVYIKNCIEVSYPRPAAQSIKITGILQEVQDDYIKMLVEKNQEVYIKIDEISWYQIVKKASN